MYFHASRFDPCHQLPVRRVPGGNLVLIVCWLVALAPGCVTPPMPVDVPVAESGVDVQTSDAGADAPRRDAVEASTDVAPQTDAPMQGDSDRNCLDPVDRDRDRDRHIAIECGGDDCDDSDSFRFPGAGLERCDGTLLDGRAAADHDEDCDPCTVAGLAPDGDHDRDGFPAIRCSNAWPGGVRPATCSDPSIAIDGTARTVRGTDCNDDPRAVSSDAGAPDASSVTGADIHPNQTEACNALDDNCNGQIDDGLTFVDYVPDCDGDLFGDSAATAVHACLVPSGRPPCAASATHARWADNHTDCNDGDTGINPVATEICNGRDDNCNGQIDEGLSFVDYYPDCDGDLYGDSATTAVHACLAPVAAPPCSASATHARWAENHGDCDDATSALNPGATEICNGVDDDCSGVVDDHVMFYDYFPDCDQDGYGDPTGTAAHGCAAPATAASCASPVTGLSWANNSTDCNDADPRVSPGATETCNGVDDNCNGLNDDLDPGANTWCGGRPASMTACVGGACVITGCIGAAMDCDGLFRSGCECSTPPAHGSVVCAAMHCGFHCDAGYHACGTACADSASLLSCGASCTACPQGPNQTASCDGTSCSTACTPGFTRLPGGGCWQGPRPIAPVSTSTVTSHRPQLRWELAAGWTGAHVEICRDPACATVIMQADAPGTTYSPGADLPTGVLFWRLHALTASGVSPSTGPTWAMIVGVLNAPVSSAFGSTLDVNRDGFADVIVGADSAVTVYHGSASGLPTTATTTVTAPPGALRFGAVADSNVNIGPSTANAGDVDGDGYSDVVVGAPGSNGNFGMVYVYRGGPTGLATVPATTLLAPDGGMFGAAVASAGDVNGDGYADVVVGAPQVLSGNGAAYVYLGGASGMASTPIATYLGTEYGWMGGCVASAGDVNADGYADVLVGASQVNGSRGMVAVYLGGPSGPAATPAVTLTGRNRDYAQFGASLASIGDFNADGYADVIVGDTSTSAFYTYFGPHVYLGSPTGLRNVPAFSLYQDDPYYVSVSGAGDLNGDGYSDFVVGEPWIPNDHSNRGNAFVYYGGASRITGGIQLYPSYDTGFFGVAVSGAGDVNGDGYPELLIGAIGWAPSPGSSSRLGKTFVYDGSASGIAGTPTVLLGNYGGDSFGGAVADSGTHRDPARRRLRRILPGASRLPSNVRSGA